MNCLAFGLDLVNFGFSWYVQMTRNGANIALNCILMIYRHIIIIKHFIHIIIYIHILKHTW